MMTPVIRPILLVLLVAIAAQVKGNSATQPTDVQQSVLLGYLSPHYAPTESPIPPVLERPPVNWPTEAPAPRVIGHTFHIFKTILRPQLFRQLITVPILQRYIRTFQTPVLETVHIQREIPF